MQRRQFITLLGGAAVAWPLTARGQRLALPVVAFIRDGTADASARFAVAFRKGLNDTGHVEGQNVTVPLVSTGDTRRRTRSAIGCVRHAGHREGEIRR